MIKYDKSFMTLFVDNEKIEFTSMEFKIFNLLIRKHPLYATYEEISDELYDADCDYYIKKNIDVNITRLRKKLKNIFVITHKKGLGMSINFDRVYLERYE